jgi:hypothetical protein
MNVFQVLHRGWQDSAGRRVGQYIFNQNIVIQNRIFATNSQKGKLSFRIYPSWVDATTKSAQQSQLWQNQYFISFVKHQDEAIKSISSIFHNSEL